MNKKYLGLGICGIAMSLLFISMIMFIGDSLATGAFAFGMVSGVFLISGLNLISESKKQPKVRGQKE